MKEILLKLVGWVCLVGFSPLAMHWDNLGILLHWFGCDLGIGG